MSYARLPSILEARLLQFLLVWKVQGEKHSRTILELQSKMDCAMRNTQEGRALVRTLREK